MTGKVIFLIFCMVFVGGVVSAQQKAPLSNSFIPPPLPRKPISNLLSIRHQLLLKTPVTPAKPLIVSPAFYCTNLAFFCRQELKFEKWTKIPLRFRLGSLAQTDWLEQKPNALNPNR